MKDEEDLRNWAQLHLATFSRVAYLLTGDHFAAEDLLQNALIKLIPRWRKIADDGNPEAYFRKILYHEHISAWRYRSRRREISATTLPEHPAETDESGELIRRLVLRQALGKLTRKQRAVLVLRYFEDLSEADTAAALGCSTGNVKSQTNYALGRLRVIAPELAQLIRERSVR